MPPRSGPRKSTSQKRKPKRKPTVVSIHKHKALMQHAEAVIEHQSKKLEKLVYMSRTQAQTIADKLEKIQDLEESSEDLINQLQSRDADGLRLVQKLKDAAKENAELREVIIHQAKQLAAK